MTWSSNCLRGGILIMMNLLRLWPGSGLGNGPGLYMTTVSRRIETHVLPLAGCIRLIWLENYWRRSTIRPATLPRKSPRAVHGNLLRRAYRLTHRKAGCNT
ncbi:hypothetical protein BJX65DRAFT_62631 [Aspergillus insuetus]